MEAPVVDFVVVLAQEAFKFILVGGWVVPIVLLLVWPMPEDERKAEKFAMRILYWFLVVVCVLALIGYVIPWALSSGNFLILCLTAVFIIVGGLQIYYFVIRDIESRR